MKISEWAIEKTDAEVEEIIKSYKTDIYNCIDDISKDEVKKVYDKIVNNNNINNRAKLFYLMQFEDLIINSRIRTNDNVIDYKNNLFK